MSESRDAERSATAEIGREWYPDNAVLTADEMQSALRVSRSKWYDIAPSLPVSYALGRQSPRYVYGEVVKFLLRTGAACPEKVA